MMKKQLLLLIIPSLLSLGSFAQYCNISTAIAYSPNMPGITNFKLNTIDRTSMAIECGGTNCNSYVNTGESTNLERGKEYSVSITHTKDAALFPNVTNNIRIWIDYNNNDVLDDAGETVLNMDHEAAGTTTSTFTIPSTATLGNTRMRVTIKMSDQGGHVLPSPCDNPADPLGYHGEFEDYTVNIAIPTGVKENLQESSINIFPNPVNDVLFIEHSFIESIPYQIVNVYGQQVVEGRLNSNSSSINVSNIKSGQYFILFNNDSELIQKRFFIQR